MRASTPKILDDLEPLLYGTYRGDHIYTTRSPKTQTHQGEDYPHTIKPPTVLTQTPNPHQPKGTTSVFSNSLIPSAPKSNHPSPSNNPPQTLHNTPHPPYPPPTPTVSTSPYTSHPYQYLTLFEHRYLHMQRTISSPISPRRIFTPA